MSNISRPDINMQFSTTDAALHASAGKPGLQYLPWRALTEVAKVIDFGAKKYSRNGWRKGMPWMELAGSTVRHVAKWISGIDLDEESGLHHLAHAATDILFLVEYYCLQLGTDDRT